MTLSLNIRQETTTDWELRWLYRSSNSPWAGGAGHFSLYEIHSLSNDRVFRWLVAYLVCCNRYVQDGVRYNASYVFLDGYISDQTFFHLCLVICFHFCIKTFLSILLGIYRSGISFCFFLNSGNSFRQIFLAISSKCTFFSALSLKLVTEVCMCSSTMVLMIRFSNPSSSSQSRLKDLSQVVPIRCIWCEFAYRPGTLGIPVLLLALEHHRKHSCQHGSKVILQDCPIFPWFFVRLM